MKHPPCRRNCGPLGQVAGTFRQGRSCCRYTAGPYCNPFCSCASPFILLNPFSSSDTKLCSRAIGEFFLHELLRRIKKGFVLGILVPPEIANPKIKQQAAFSVGSPLLLRSGSRRILIPLPIASSGQRTWRSATGSGLCRTYRRPIRVVRVL